MNAQTEAPALTAPTRRPRRATTSAERPPTGPPKTIRDVEDLLSRTLADLANGRISARRAKAIAFGCRVLGEIMVGGRFIELSQLLDHMKAEIAEVRAARGGLNGVAPQK